MFPVNSRVSTEFNVCPKTSRDGVKEVSSSATAATKVFKEAAPAVKSTARVSFAAAIVVVVVGVIAKVVAVFAAIWNYITKKKSDLSPEAIPSAGFNVRNLEEESPQEVAPVIVNEKKKGLSQANVEDIYILKNSSEDPIGGPFVNFLQKPVVPHSRAKKSEVKDLQLKGRILPSLPPQPNKLIHVSPVRIILKEPGNLPKEVGSNSMHTPVKLMSADSSSSRQEVINSNKKIRMAKQPIGGRRPPTQVGGHTLHVTVGSRKA